MKVATVIKELLKSDRSLVAFNKFTKTFLKRENGILIAFDAQGNYLDIEVINQEDYRFYIRTCNTKEDLDNLMEGCVT